MDAIDGDNRVTAKLSRLIGIAGTVNVSSADAIML